MTTIQEQHQGQERLLDAIENELGRLLTPSVRQAFRCVPRTDFIDSYYTQRQNTLTWDEVTTPSIEDVFQDKALTTKLDRRGMPISSTSQPSVMAVQLEQLDVHPGHHILEIGTGTGWNAALLGSLVGLEGSVVSIDIDGDLVNTAMRHLQDTGQSPPVSVSLGDGFEGYPRGGLAVYDRLLATCGFRQIPTPWVTLLRDQGTLVGNLLLNLASVFVRLEKTAEAVLTGRFFSLDASYMEMRRSATNAIYRGQRINWNEVDGRPQRVCTLALLETEDLSTMLADPACALLLQSFIPSITRMYRFSEDEREPVSYLRMHPSSPQMIRVDRDHLTVYGKEDMASELALQNLMKAIHAFVQLRPHIEDFVVMWKRGNMSVALDHTEFLLIVPDNDTCEHNASL